MSHPRTRHSRKRSVGQQSDDNWPELQELSQWLDQLEGGAQPIQKQQQLKQQRPADLSPSYIDTLVSPSTSSSDAYVSPAIKPFSINSIPSLFSSEDHQNPPMDEEEDFTWLVVVILATALLISLVSLAKALGQKFGLVSFSNNNESRSHHGGHGNGLPGHPSRYPGHGPHQVPAEDDPDPDAQLNEADERWALMTEAQRQAFDTTRAFQAVHPPLSVPTDISLSQYLSIQEKGVSAWEFEASFDNQRVQVHDRTELSFPSMNNLESSIQTNLPMPKQQEVYYWEVKMFEKSPDTVISVGVSTKPYPTTRLPGWTRHSVAYFSKDGHKYCNSPFSGFPYGPAYYEGDVVGCGYRPRTGTIFFTRNGKRLEDAYTGLRFNLFPTVGATGPCILHVNLGQSGFVFVEANVKKWGLAPANGSLIPPPAYGSELGSILLEAGSTTVSPAPPMRRPNLQSSRSRARIEAAGVLVQIEQEDGIQSNGSEYSKKASNHAKQNISLSKMSAPQGNGLAPPQYSVAIDTTSESDDETTTLISETISRPIGRGRSGTTTSSASGSGSRR